MKVPLESYPNPGSKVFSLVARVPFTPVDLDVGRLARGEWNALSDRFRVWFIPKIDGRDDRPLCNLTLRKLDPDGGVLLFMHITVNLDATYGESKHSRPEHFVVGILCNDDVRARTALGCILDGPPSFHKRRELRLVESRWRRDPHVLMYYLANIHSALSATSDGPRATLRVREEASDEILAVMKKGMTGWWNREALAEAGTPANQ